MKDKFENKLARLLRYISKKCKVESVTLEIISNGIRHLYALAKTDTQIAHDFAYYQIYKGLIYGSGLNLTYEEIYDIWMDIIYEDEHITVKSTGHDYDFIATIEVKDNEEFTKGHEEEKLVIVFTDEYEHLEPARVRCVHWGGILADDEGYATVEALTSGKFYTVWESEFNEEEFYATL